MNYAVTAIDFQAAVNTVDGLIPHPEDLNEFTVLNSGLNLSQMYDNALEDLRDILAVFGYKGGDPLANLEKLNQKIQEFHGTTATLNGMMLREQIMAPLQGKIIDMMAVEAQNFKKFVHEKQNEISQVFLELVNQVIMESSNDDTYGDMALKLFAELNEIKFETSSGILTLKGEITGGSIGGGKRLSNDFKADYKYLTESVIKRLKAGIERADFSGNVDPNIKQLIDRDPNFSRRLLLLAQVRGIDVSALYENVGAPQLQIQESSDGLMIYYDILKPFTEQMTAINGTKAEKAAEAYFNNLPNDKKEAQLQQLNQLTINFMNSNNAFNTANLSPERGEQLQKYFYKAIHDIIYQYPAALFTGKNEQGIIGILGEIQGLYYVYALLGDADPSIDVSTIAKWIGGDTTAGGGIKTSADLILQEVGSHLGFGIQVKNSMDLTGATSFSDFVLNNGPDSGFFTQLINFGIDPKIVQALNDIFVMQGFNIDYHLKGRTAVPGVITSIPNTDIYLSSYAKLSELIQRAQRYMSLAAAMIMRVRYLQSQDFNQNNTLWIVGGTAMISAAQILKQLINQIKGQLNRNIFNASATTKLGDKGFTIIDYINGHHQNISDLKTTLGTSFNFHKI